MPATNRETSTNSKLKDFTEHSVVASSEKADKVKEVSKATLWVFSAFTLVLVFFVLLFAYLFFRERGGLSNVVSNLNPLETRELVRVVNEYDEFELQVNNEVLKNILYNNVVVPGTNCFINGKDKGTCFDSKYLDIVFTPNKPNETKEVDLGEGREVSYIAHQKGSNTLEVVISISEYDEVVKLIPIEPFNLMLNKSLLEVLLYTTVTEDRKNFPYVRDSVDNQWDRLMNDNTLLITII